MGKQQIEALLLDVALLIEVMLEQNSLQQNSKKDFFEDFTKVSIKQLVYIKEAAKSHREKVSMQEINSEDLKESMVDIRRRLMGLKHIPNRFARIIQDAIFKSTRCIESI